MVLHTWEEYLNIIDKEVTKRNELSPAELLEFLKLTQAKDAHKKDFTEQRRRTWFALVLKRMNDFNSASLVALWKELQAAKIKTDAYKGNFAGEWEKALVRCLEAGELLEVLEIYIEMEGSFPVQLAQKWSQLGAREVGSWPASSLGFVIYAFGHMRLRPEDEFVRAWTEKVTSGKVVEFSPSAVADLLFGVGKLWLKDERLEKTIRELVERCESNQVFKMSAQCMIKSLYGLIEMKMDPLDINPKFMDLYLERVTPALDKLSAKELSTSAWNLCRINMDPGTVFTKNWTRYTMAKMGKFSARDLYITLLGAVHLKLSGNDFAVPWMDYTTSKLKDFWPQALAAVLMDLHFLETRPTPGFLIEWEKAARRNFSEMYTKDLVGVMVGLAMINRAPERNFLDDWYKEVKRKAERFTKNSLEDLDKAFGELKMEMRKDVEEELERATEIRAGGEVAEEPISSRPKALS